MWALLNRLQLFFNPISEEKFMDPKLILGIFSTALTVAPEIIGTIGQAVSLIKGAVHGNTLSDEDWDHVHMSAYLALSHLAGTAAAQKTFNGTLNTDQMSQAEAQHVALTAAANLPTFAPNVAHTLTPEQQSAIALGPSILPVHDISEPAVDAWVKPGEVTFNKIPPALVTTTLDADELAMFREFVKFRAANHPAV